MKLDMHIFTYSDIFGKTIDLSQAATIPPEELPKKPKSSRQTEIPIQDFRKSTKEWNSTGGMHVVYARGLKRMTLQRVLVAQIVFEMEKVTISDLMTLYDNILYLQDMAASDEQFRRKFGVALEALTKILTNSRITHTPNKASLGRLRLKLQMLDGFYIPLRNLEHTKKYFKGKYQLIQGTKIGIPVDKLPLQRFIGVGYKDHGTARDLAFNGEPSWKEYCRMRLWSSLT